MEITLNENERLDDLQRNGYRLIQNAELFCFGIDAVLLSTFAKVGKGENVLDLGCGNGVIPILLEAKNQGDHYSGLEIQEVNVDLARRNTQINNLTDKIDIVQGDIKEASNIFGGASFHVITTNPPYMNQNHGLINPDSCKAIARHELLCTLEDVIRESSKLLKERGRLYMIHRPQRLVEIFSVMTKYKLEPKRIKMVHPHVGKEASMVLIEAIKGAGALMITEAPLIVHNEDGKYTDDLIKWYE